MSQEDVLSSATVTWKPQPGPQTALIHCTWADEIFFGGARGGGKSDASLGRFLIKSLQFGKGVKGMFIRRELPQLEPFIARAKELFTPHGAEWRENTKTFRFPNGAHCRFRFLDRDSDADRVLGHDYTDICIEEAGNFPSSAPIMKLKGTLRSSKGIPCQMVLTGNPGGPGQGWIRVRYIDPNPNGYFPIKEVETRSVNGKPFEATNTRIFIPSKITDNKILMENDPNYISRLAQTGSEQLVRAWLDGDFYVTESAFFDCWSHHKHVIPATEIPDWWLRFRAADWGSARPFCVLWMAIAGEDWQHPTTKRIVPKGAIVVYREWYGIKTRLDGTFEVNQGIKMFAEPVARGILAREAKRESIQYGVMDPSAFSVDGGPSIAERMFYATNGEVAFRRADNRRIGTLGSLSGWDQVRSRMVGEDGAPMLYAMTNCIHLIRTIPSMQHDADRPEDMMTDSEDHACFAAGTMVDTSDGPVAIENLCTGMVNTPSGLHQYSAGLTRKDADVVRAFFSDGTSLVCTPDHRFVCDDGEIRAISRLISSDHGTVRISSTDRDSQCLSPSYRSRLKSFLGCAITFVGSIFRTKVRDFIAPFGSTSMAPSLAGCMSTTSTETGPTTTSLTSLFSPHSSTTGLRSWQEASTARTSATAARLPLSRPSSALPSGTGQTTAEPGTRNTTRRIRICSTPRWSATAATVERFIRLPGRTSRHSAVTRASQPTEEHLASTTCQGSVPSAVEASTPTGTRKSRPALARAAASHPGTRVAYLVALEPAGRADVYCLNVPDAGLFCVEGGLVVSNCDALRYGCMSRPYIRHEDQPRAKPRTIQEISLNELYESLPDETSSAGRV